MAGLRTCPRPQTLSALHAEGALQELAPHLATCEHCAAIVADFDALRAAGQALGGPRLDPERQAQIRGELLVLAKAAAREPHPRRWIGVAVATAAGALAAAVALFVWWGSAEPTEEDAAPASHATIQAQAGTDYQRLGDRHDEIVRLREGTIKLEVNPLGMGERFRVATRDGEVEVRGTSFEVSATRERLQQVRVFRGHVVVRPQGQPAVDLLGGEHWTAAKPAPAPAPSAAAELPPLQLDGLARTSAVITRRLAKLWTASAALTTAPGLAVDKPTAAGKAQRSSAEPSSKRPSPSTAELAFQEGFSAFRSKDYERAVAAFDNVPADSALGEDAAYWRAMALFKSQRPGPAASALERFLDDFPRSARRGSASVALGRIHLDQGRTEAARRCFEDAANDLDPKVRSAAQEGLDALGASPD